MTFDKWFKQQSLIVKVILLIIPFVGTLVEVLVRVSRLLKKNTTVNIVGLVLSIFAFWVWEVADIIYLVLKDDLLLLE